MFIAKVTADMKSQSDFGLKAFVVKSQVEISKPLVF